jgi:hypothetical protein
MGTRWYQEVWLEEWEHALHLRKHLSSPWIFRGHISPLWTLTTSLERALSVPASATRHEILQMETDILETLQLVAPNYGIRTPPGSRSTEWLALLQHHGGATRLLDVTMSFFVAAFFAAEDPHSTPTIWCVQPYPLVVGAHCVANGDAHASDPFDDESPGSFERAITFANDLIENSIGRESMHNLVVPIEPRFRSERMQAQQGLFLAPTDPARGFEDGLANSVRACGTGPEPVEPWRYATEGAAWAERWPWIDRATVLKLVIDGSARNEILNDLDEMNVTATSLFRGFDGFARSLRQELRNLAPSTDRSRRLLRGFMGGKPDSAAPQRRQGKMPG